MKLSKTFNSIVKRKMKTESVKRLLSKYFHYETFNSTKEQ